MMQLERVVQVRLRYLTRGTEAGVPSDFRNVLRVRHLAVWMHWRWAASEARLFVSIPFESNTGPLRDVFGGGSLTPCWRMHFANLAKRWSRLPAETASPTTSHKWAPPPPEHFVSAFCS
jgi:hypothetical protein